MIHIFNIETSSFVMGVVAECDVGLHMKTLTRADEEYDVYR